MDQQNGLFLIIEDEPLINNRFFVELVWGIKATGNVLSNVQAYWQNNQTLNKGDAADDDTQTVE